MIVIGLAGQAGVGKNVIADYLREAYGFVQFAWSDALYAEVAAAFGVGDVLLRLRETKEVPTIALAGENCSDLAFIDVLMAQGVKSGNTPLSPRQVLQWWGAEYRRAQDTGYWVNRAAESIAALRASVPYPEQVPQFFVESGTRFENERDWIHNNGGNVWHVYRDGHVAPGQGHSSAEPLPVLSYERQIWNNDTIERLQRGVDTLLRTSYSFVRVEPMLPIVEPGEA